MEASLLAEEMLLPFLCGDSRVFAGLEETGEVARSDTEAVFFMGLQAKMLSLRQHFGNNL
jgi:hypothetical protein